MNELPLLRLLKIHASIIYFKFIKRSRNLFLYLVAVIMTLFLICVGVILVCLSILINIATGVFSFGIALTIISAVLLAFLLTQKVWMMIFEADQLIENIEKGGEK